MYAALSGLPAAPPRLSPARTTFEPFGVTPPKQGAAWARRMVPKPRLLNLAAFALIACARIACAQTATQYVYTYTLSGTNGYDVTWTTKPMAAVTGQINISTADLASYSVTGSAWAGYTLTTVSLDLTGNSCVGGCVGAVQDTQFTQPPSAFISSINDTSEGVTAADYSTAGTYTHSGSILVDDYTCCGTFYVQGTDTLTVAAVCQVTVPKWTQCQGQPGHWGGELYDSHTQQNCGRNHDQACTMCSLGCATTALGIGLDAAGATLLPGLSRPLFLDPGTLNQFMVATPGDYDSDHNVVFETTTLDVGYANRSLGGQKAIYFDDSLTGLNAADALKGAVCQGNPVIVKVSPVAGCQVQFGPPGGHYVVVTGEHDDSNGQPHFDIVDPGCATITSLDAYQNLFQIRGFVPDPANVSTVEVVTGDNADLLITDPSGNQTGSLNGTVIKQIPRSNYSQDFLTDNDTGQQATGVAHSINLFQPAEGMYQITVSGLKLGTYALSVDPFSTDGTPQQRFSIAGVAAVGSSSSFQVQFSSQPGSTSSAAVVASFESTLADISNSLALGLIDNAGIANSLSSKINAASAAAASGDYNTAMNNLNAFTNQVNAQTGKHITGIAPQVLLSDANSLLVQMP